jgi:4-amino-4-deoxy-L-arabinose transferase-like glycosyltransferase
MTRTTRTVERPDRSREPAGPGRRTIDRWFVVALLALVALGVAVRVTYTIRVSSDLPFTGDAETYHLLAERLADGDGFVRPRGDLAGSPTAEFPPLFPAVLAVVDLAGGDSVEAQKLVTSVLGAGTVLVIGLLGRRVWSATAGLVAAALAAVYPMLFQVDGALMAESLSALLVAGFLLAIYRAVDRRSIVDWAVAGALAGLSALTRTEGLLLLLFVAVPAALFRPRGRQRAGEDAPMQWRGLAACALALLVVVTPWIVRNYVTFDRFIPISNNSGTLIAGANCDRTYFGQYRGVWRFECVTDIDVAGLSEPEVADRFREVGTDYAREHAGEVPRVVATRVLRTFGLFEPKEQIDWESFEGRDITWQVAGHRMFLVMLPFCIVGVVVLWRSRRASWPLVAPVLLVAFTSALGYGNQRFRITAEPALIVLAAVAVAALARGIRRRVASPPTAS